MDTLVVPVVVVVLVVVSVVVVVVVVAMFTITPPTLRLVAGAAARMAAEGTADFTLLFTFLRMSRTNVPVGALRPLDVF